MPVGEFEGEGGRGDPDILREKLAELGGGAGNKALRVALDWDIDRYWDARQPLVDNGEILLGRGKGGSVILVIAEEEEAVEAEPARVNEVELYPPIKEQIEKNWLRQQGVDTAKKKYVVEITAQQGKKKTGGRWTRPDLSILTVERFDFPPAKVLDLITFEVKPGDDISILGVYEALSHKKFATKSYVAFNASRACFFEGGQEGDRIQFACREHGIGLLLMEQVDDESTWEELVAPARTFPDNREIDGKIKQLFAGSLDEIRDWLA